jgi:hypothetical protein
MVVSGWVIHYLKVQLEWSSIDTYRTIFWAYAGIGLLKFILAFSLSKAVEAEKKVAPVVDPETAPLLGGGSEDQEPKKKKNFILSKLPEISPESRIIVLNLCILFALDAFASGLAPL